MYDRKRGVDVAHGKLVLQEMGRLHAASLLLEKTLPNNSITDTWDVFTEEWMRDDKIKDMFTSMMKSQLDGAAKILEKVMSQPASVENKIVG